MKIVTFAACGALTLLVGTLTGCSARTASEVHVQQVVMREAEVLPPGVVQYVWEEPMVNIVNVPPGLDPEGHYYRPAHRAVVEVRQGRWRAVEAE